MKKRSNFYLAAAAILALACAIVWVVQTPGSDKTRGGTTADGQARKPGVRAPSRDKHASKSARSPLELEIERLSLAEVYAMLPGKGEGKELDLMIGSPEWDRASGPHWTHETLAKQVDRESVERTRLLFRRLGKLEGEEALDFLLERYGKEQGFTGLAMTFAILGWMEADPEAAIRAFQQLNRCNTPNLPSMMWRNETVLTGFGGELRPAIVQFALREVLRSASLGHPERGMDLLREFPWNYHVNFHSGVTGYAQALAENPDVDWRGLRDQLAELVDDRQNERGERNEPSQVLWTQEVTNLDRTVVQLWANRDLSAAVDWYVRELEWDQTAMTTNSRALTVFQGVSKGDRWKVMRWIENNHGRNGWDDSLIVDYTMAWAMGPPDDFVDRLVSLPEDEPRRLEIVNRYSFSSSGNGGSVMRIPSDQARRLIDAARLSNENRTGLMKKIDALDEAARKADVRYF
jgi:hypothetical protein